MARDGDFATSGGSQSPLFTLKHQLIQSLVGQWNGRAMHCDELQVAIDQELRLFDLVKSLHHQEVYTLSRRRVLAALAGLPLALLTASPRQIKLNRHPEVFLPECVASITACWYLLNGGDGLATIEHTLPVYHPTLVTWSTQSSRYQRTAAALAAQGSLLMALVSYHRFRLQDALVSANQAVELAKLSDDRNLLVYALLLLGSMYNENNQSHVMLHKHLEAEQFLPHIIAPLQSFISAELAHAYAQNNQVSEALDTIQKARDLFSDDFSEAPCYVSADYNASQLILFEGLTHVTLGTHDLDQASMHYAQARTALAAIDTLPTDTHIPQRLRVEITNYQAQAAIGVGDLDEAEEHLLAGIQGALALGSEKRRQEVLANWQHAQERWPQEQRLRALGDLLLPSV